MPRQFKNGKCFYSFNYKTDNGTAIIHEILDTDSPPRVEFQILDKTHTFYMVVQRAVSVHAAKCIIARQLKFKRNDSDHKIFIRSI